MGRTSRSPVSNLPAVANLSKLSSKLAVYAEHFGFMQRYLFGYSACPIPALLLVESTASTYSAYPRGCSLTNGRGRQIGSAERTAVSHTGRDGLLRKAFAEGSAGGVLSARVFAGSTEWHCAAGTGR